MFVRAPLLLQVLLLTPIIVVGCGPVPGGALQGELTATPSDWSNVLDGERAICEIESRPSDPHSIQLDCFLYEGSLYVQSHRWAFAPWWPTTSWAAVWRAYPEVRVRVGEEIFEVLAVLVTDPALRDPILASRGYDPVPPGIALFRFDPRDSR